jgi:excisionase family DNA binding protein
MRVPGSSPFPQSDADISAPGRSKPIIPTPSSSGPPLLKQALERESALLQTTKPKYLRTAQVAELLQVSPKTVSRWAQEGRLPFFRTLGGHRRYPDREIRALLETLSESSSAG